MHTSSCPRHTSLSSMKPIETIQGRSQDIIISSRDAFVQLWNNDVIVFKNPNKYQLGCLQAQYGTQLVLPLIQQKKDPTNTYKTDLRGK